MRTTKTLFSASLILLQLLVSSKLYSQTFRDDIVVKTTVFSMEAVQQNSGNILFKINKVGDTNVEEFPLNSLKLEPFRTLYSNKINEIDNSISVNEAMSTADKVFYDIKVTFLEDFVNAEQRAGTVTVGSNIPLFIEKHNSTDELVVKYLKDINAKPINGNGEYGESLKDSDTLDNGTEYKIGEFNISEVSIEFFEGYIENIFVDGIISFDTPDNGNIPEKLKSYTLNKIRFRNKYGIGFQTNKNYETLVRNRLFDPNNDNLSLGIFVSDVIKYKSYMELLRKDYSPANGVVRLPAGKTEILKKSPLSRTFEVLVFSDFLGIEQENPNGLVQTEMSYRFNLNSRRFGVIRPFRGIMEGAGVFQYVRPVIGINKIEENGRFLIPEVESEIIGEAPNQMIEKAIYTDPIELLRHQNWNIGLDLNILYVEDSDLKYHLYGDVGFRYGRTPIREEILEIGSGGEIIGTGNFNDFGVGYNTYFLQSHIDFLPNENFGISISYRTSYVTPAFNELEMRTFERTGAEQEEFKRWYNTFILMGRVKTSKNGSLFARYRFNYQKGNVEKNFHQFQVGYSFFLFNKSKLENGQQTNP